MRDEKVKVLQALRAPVLKMSFKGMRAIWRRRAWHRIPDPNLCRGAFAHVDNWRWQGVPFYLQSGKGLKEKVSEITLQFKRVPHLLFPESASPRPNRLAICIQPDEAIQLRFDIKKPGAGMSTAPVDMAFAYSEHFGDSVLPEAYERLLLDALQGDASLFARADEIELAWKLIDPLTRMGAPLRYAIGSWGPSRAKDLIAAEGCSWMYSCVDGVA